MSHRILSALALSATLAAGPAAASDEGILSLDVEGPCWGIGEMPRGLPALTGTINPFGVERACQVLSGSMVAQWAPVPDATGYAVIVIEVGEDDRWHLSQVLEVDDPKAEVDFEDLGKGWYAFGVTAVSGGQGVGTTSPFTVVEKVAPREPAADADEGGAAGVDELLAQIDELHALLDEVEGELKSAYDAIDYYETATEAQKERITTLERANVRLRALVHALRDRLIKALDENQELKARLASSRS